MISTSASCDPIGRLIVLVVMVLLGEPREMVFSAILDSALMMAGL